MSIATELQDLNDNIKDAYSEVSTRYGNVPADKNMVNLPAAIATVRQYDIARKLYGGNTLSLRDPYARTISEPFLPSNITVIGARALAHAYGSQGRYDSSERRGTNFSNITRIEYGGMSYAFSPFPTYGYFYARGMIEDIDFSSLTEVENYGLENAYSYNRVRTINFPELVSADSYAFANAFYASSAENVVASFPKLEELNGYSSMYCFQEAFAAPDGDTKGLVSVDFSALKEVDNSSYAFKSAFSGNKMLSSVDFSSLTSIHAQSCFERAFYNCSSLTDTSCFSALEEVLQTASTNGDEFSYCFAKSGIQTVSFPKLATVSSTWHPFSRAFSDCTSLTTASFPKLTSALFRCFEYAFSGDTALTSFSAPLLHTVGAGAFSYAFNGCTALTSVDFSGLSEIPSSAGYPFENAFYGCTSLTTVSFPSLAVIQGSSGNGCFYNAFRGCTSLTSVSFPAVTSDTFGTARSAFANMLYGDSNVTLHFPAGTESVVQALSGYPNFGGTNTTVLFDL